MDRSSVFFVALGGQAVVRRRRVPGSQGETPRQQQVAQGAGPRSRCNRKAGVREAYERRTIRLLGWAAYPPSTECESAANILRDRQQRTSARLQRLDPEGHGGPAVVPCTG